MNTDLPGRSTEVSENYRFSFDSFIFSLLSIELISLVESLQSSELGKHFLTTHGTKNNTLHT